AARGHSLGLQHSNEFDRGAARRIHDASPSGRSEHPVHRDGPSRSGRGPSDRRVLRGRSRSRPAPGVPTRRRQEGGKALARPKDGLERAPNPLARPDLSVNALLGSTLLLSGSVYRARIMKVLITYGLESKAISSLTNAHEVDDQELAPKGLLAAIP